MSARTHRRCKGKDKLTETQAKTRAWHLRKTGAIMSAYRCTCHLPNGGRAWHVGHTLR